MPAYKLKERRKGGKEGKTGKNLTGTRLIGERKQIECHTNQENRKRPRLREEILVKSFGKSELERRMKRRA